MPAKKTAKSSGYDYVMTHPKEIGMHLGKWILIYDNEIVSAGDDLIRIYRQFEEDHPNETPFVMKIPKTQDMLFHANNSQVQLQISK